MSEADDTAKTGSTSAPAAGGGAAPGGAADAGAAAADAAADAKTKSDNDFTAALREATAAKAGKGADATAGKASDAKPGDDAAAKGADDKDDKGTSADAAAGSDKSAGADTATGKTTDKSPNNADLKVDWSKVSPALKAAYEAGTPEIKTALEAEVLKGLKRGQEIARLKGTISDNKHRRSPASTSRRSGRGAADLKKALSGTAMAALEKEAPEVTAALKEVTGPIIAEIENAAKDLDARADEDLRTEADSEAKVLADLHPDWEKVTGSKPFEEWLEAAAPHIKAMVSRNAVATALFPQGRIVDGQEAALVLTLFKETTGFGSAAGVQTAPGAKPNGTGGSQQPSPVDKKRALQRDTARTTELRGVAAGTGTDEQDFAANLREATRLKALEKQRATA